MKRIKIMSIFGTRPEAIKMAPVILELQKRKEVEHRVAVTAQHREMLDQVNTLFDIKADVDLDIMKEKQTLTEITTRALEGLEHVIRDEHPDLILVQGDTTTAFVAALAAFYHKVAVGHVEAGLRTDDKYSPYPEEMNRRLISVLGDLHFAPTAEAKQHLLESGVKEPHIYLTGNTVVDALFHILALPGIKLPPEVQRIFARPSRVIFVETHRRENLGEPMRETCLAIKDIVESFSDVQIAFSVHKNPLVREVVFGELSGIDRIHLLEPLDYPVMVKLLKECYMVLSDSGGIQEEAPSLGKPVLVLRMNTERPEGIRAGTAKLVGTKRSVIFEETRRVLVDEAAYRSMSQAVNPYGDGHAAERTVDAILHFYGMRDSAPDSFIPRGISNCSIANWQGQ